MEKEKPEPGPRRWAVQWRSRNRSDGVSRHWMWENALCPLLFRSRSEARAYIHSNFGYIANRPDLRAEPHGWLLPRAVRVSVILKETR